MQALARSLPSFRLRPPYGRQIYSLARAGYYFPFMSLTNEKKTPHMALFAGTLLNMAVFGAMISYAMQGLSFIVPRNTMPNIARPYRSPVGVPGALVTIVIALVTLWYQLQDPVYRVAVYYVAGFYVLGILYFALSKGQKGHA